MSSELKQLTFFELDFLVNVARLGSVRGAARQEHLTPSHASKLMARIEAKFGRPLLRRSTSGVTLTREALGIVKAAQTVLETFDEHISSRGEASQKGRPSRIYSIGSLSHLNKHVVAPVIAQLEGAEEHSQRFRLMDLPPDQVGPMANKGILDIVIHTDKNVLGKLWAASLVGTIEWGFYCRVNHPVLSRSQLDQLIRYPFVVPTYWHDGGFAVGNDFCPIPWSDRIKGHEASNAETALQIVAWSDHVAFLPKSMVRRQMNGLQEIAVPGIDRVSRDVFLGVQRDEVPAKLQKLFRSALTNWLR